jgi:hypothetical protein
MAEVLRNSPQLNMGVGTEQMLGALVVGSRLLRQTRGHPAI